MSILRLVNRPDVLYVVRNGNRNEELRYSLRSLAHLPHGRVFISGFAPSLVDRSKIIYLPNEQRGTKQANARANLIRGLSDTRLSRYFVMMNDDFYIMHPMQKLPALHMAAVAHKLDQYRKRYAFQGYLKAMSQTNDLLLSLGVQKPLSYELHVPMRFDKYRLLELLRKYGHVVGLHYRTLYGNLYQKGARYMEDVKVYGAKDGEHLEDRPFLSTADNMHHPVGAYIRKMFPDPSPYERV